MWSEAPVERLTVGDLVDVATRRLVAAGLPTPRRDAERIVADLVELAPGRLALDRDRALEPDCHFRVMAAVARRGAGEPVQYVTGVAGFRHLVVRCDRRALIPRPETEGVVDRALELDRSGVVADIGTGTGCLALALRQEGAYRAVIAVDRSAEALGLARDNGRWLGLEIGLVRGDLTRPLAARSIDLLVSNPPYVSALEYDALEAGVRDYEPRSALQSGPDGLAATAQLVADGLRVVRPGGAMVLELAAARAQESAELARRAGWQPVRVDDDLFGRPRYLVARREG